MKRLIRILGPIANLDFDKLLLVQLLSHFADAIILFLFGTMLIQITGGAEKSIAIAFCAFLLPQLLLGVITGTICDKLPRKAVLSLSFLLRFVVLLMLIFTPEKPSVPVIYAYLFAIGTGAAFFYPAKAAAVSNTVKSGDLKTGNIFISPTGAISILLGAFAANVLFMTGMKIAFGTVCAMYLAALVLTQFIKFRIPQKPSNHAGILSDTAKYFAKHGKILYLTSVALFLQFTLSVFLNGLNSLITDVYELSVIDLTYIRTLLALGIILGIAAGFVIVRFLSVSRLIAYTFLTLSAVFLTAPLCTTVNTAWIWLLPAGIAVSIMTATLDALLLKILPDKHRGKIFGLQLGLTTLTFMGGTVIVANAFGFINPVDAFRGTAFLTFLLCACLPIFDKSFRNLVFRAVNIGSLKHKNKNV